MAAGRVKSAAKTAEKKAIMAERWIVHTLEA